jgi:hypothetical protein
MSDFSPEEQELADAFAAVHAAAPVQEWRGRPPRRFKSRPDWVRPLAGVVALAVVGGGLGGYFGLRAANSGGTAGSGGPEARSAAAMAFDSANGTMLLFGGYGIHGPLNDTWTWDGSSWTQQHPSTSPPARGGSLMAYDATSRTVVLLGGTNFPEFGGVISSGSGYACPGVVTPTVASPAIGSSGGAVPAETPPPNGSTSVLTPLPVPTGPLPACTPSPPDTNAPRVFLDTWVWDGGNWHQAAGDKPEFAAETQMATDPVSGSVLAVSTVPSVRPLGLACPVPATPPASGNFPDCGGSGFSVRYLAYLWQGNHWMQAPSPPPAATTAGYSAPFVTLVDDPSSGHLSLFREVLGGPVPVPCAVPAPTKTGGPASTSLPSILPEPCLQQGNPTSSPPTLSGSVAVWTGNAWTSGPAFSGAPPLVPHNFVAVGDRAHHDVVFYLESTGETWVWRGKWMQLHTTTGPSPPFLIGAAATYDAKTNAVVLYGGETQNGSGMAVNDATWVWDGANWLKRSGGLAVAVPTPTLPQIPPSSACPKPSAKPPVGDALPACPPPNGTGGGGAPGSAGGAAPATATAASAG